MKEILQNNKYLIILWILCILGLFYFCGHYSQILIDFGREVYYPQRLLAGKILYKDLFNIYGPMSYQINAVLYKIFGAKLSTLYFAGSICSLLTVSGIYLIARKFLSGFLSLCIGIFTIAAGIATTSIFNFHFPYSWAVLYGFVTFLFSLYFLLNCSENKNNLYISSFLAGISITCKYDFLIYGLVVLFFIIKSKDCKALLSFLFPPILSYGILFAQGLKFSDLINSLNIINHMAKSKTLEYFYQNSGIYFHPKVLLTDFVLFLKSAIPFSGILFGYYVFNKRKFVAILSFSLSFIAFFLLFDTKLVFGFLPILLLISLILGYKKTNTNAKILVISALAAASKVFWVLLLGSYGNYYVSIILTAFLAMLFVYLPKELQKPAGIYLIIISTLILAQNIYIRKSVNSKIQTPKGVIYTTKSLSESTNELISKISGQAVIFPEGLTVNFLSDTYSDDFYNSLLPLYIETFGEEKIVEHFKKTKPQYIVLNNLNMKDYYYEYICKDYGLQFCGFVQENYTMQEIIGNEFRYIIFMLK